MSSESPFYSALQEAIAANLHRSPPSSGFSGRVIAVEDIQLNDIVIGVFGASGSGKSTFIQALVEDKIFPASKFSGILCVQISIPCAENHLILVEMPGFGDEGISDARILSTIYTWLETLYKKKKLLNGTIFVNPITNTTSSSSSDQTLKILRRLYGESHHEFVTLISTKWNEIPLNKCVEAQQRERELAATSWRRFLNGHSPGLTARFNIRINQTAFLQATEALSALVGQMQSANPGIKLLIQKQVIDDGLPLYWTDAGKVVFTMEEIEQYRGTTIIHVPRITIPEHSIGEESIAPSVDISLEEINDNDIIVGVFGETGAGKSSFVHALSNGAQSSIRIGHHVSGTARVTCVRVWVPQLKSYVVVVDTPGFNNPTRTDVEVLETIAEWLIKLYQSKRSLNAALYLQRITDIRIDSGAQQSLNIFLSMYGRSHYDHLGLVTTMWNNVPWFEFNKAEKREKELSSHSRFSFVRAIDGASIQRFNLGTTESGYHDSTRIISKLVRRISDNPRIQLRIQEQMIAERLPLRETEAGTNAMRESGLPEEVRVDAINEDDIIIGVYGATGVGKTTFIKTLAEGHATWLTVGEGLDPGTKDISCVRILVPGTDGSVVLVDTPGFDDPTKTDGEILTMITRWLRDLQGNGLLMSGAIYINDITSVRIDSGTQRAMGIFRNMFGEAENDRIMLVTSKWNDVPPGNTASAEDREKELFGDAWAIFLNSQPPAGTARFNCDLGVDDGSASDSASATLMTLLRRLENREGIKLLIQKQMIDQQMSIEMTDAGRLAFEVPQDDDDMAAEEVKLDDIKKDDILICLLGETGSGKTTFITALAGDDAPGLYIGHDLEAATKLVTCVRFTIPHMGASVVLVDTPGFNQDKQSDSQTLEIIADWLKQSYTLGRKLHGIIFLQNVAASPRTSGAERTSKIFQKMVYGDAPAQKVRYDQITFVTTMWDEISRDKHSARMKAEEDEQWLTNTRWFSFLKTEKPASLKRFDNTTPQSAHDHALAAIRTLIKGTSKPKTLKLRIQEEMVVNKMQVAKTTAGKFAKLQKQAKK